MDDTPGRRGDAFRALYQENAPALLGYALRRVAAPADAADVVAEAFLVAWRRLDDVPPGTQARPWLFGVARRVLANQRRGDLRRSALADKLRQDLVQHVHLDDGAAGAVPPAVAAVREAVERLPEDDREILRLTTWEGLAPTELATALGIPPATVRTRLHRARRRLRQALEGAAPSGNGHGEAVSGNGSEGRETEPRGNAGGSPGSGSQSESRRSGGAVLAPAGVERSARGGHVVAGERLLASDGREEP